MAPAIGIMQGRLTPPSSGRFQCFPREGWDAEFSTAATVGLACIEWIYDSWGADINPLSTDSGLEKMRSLSRQHGVVVRSICADWFMDHPLIPLSSVAQMENLNRLRWLGARAEAASIQRVVLPFVDSSRVDPALTPELARLLLGVAAEFRSAGVEIHLETDLNPTEFGQLLSHLPHDVFKVNYDTGNSASLGYLPEEEFSAYGRRIGSVHIKDRVRGAGTVPLGSGDADFTAVFDGLNGARYMGDLILQVARDIPGDEVSWATKNRRFVETLLNKGAGSSTWI